MFERMREDIQSVFHRDPAARSAFEVLTCYPGLHAVWLHRLAHALHARRHGALGDGHGGAYGVQRLEPVDGRAVLASERVQELLVPRGRLAVLPRCRFCQ